MQSPALDKALKQIEALGAESAKWKSACEADPVYRAAKQRAEDNSPRAYSFESLASGVADGRVKSRNEAIRTMNRRRKAILQEIRNGKSEVA